MKPNHAIFLGFALTILASLLIYYILLRMVQRRITAAVLARNAANATAAAENA
jgi:hypothetical protein